MGIVKILAKTYGNYFLTTQAIKVAETMKKDENIVVGLGKLFLVDKLMDTATWLIRPEDNKWTFFLRRVTLKKMRETSKSCVASFFNSIPYGIIKTVKWLEIDSWRFSWTI